MMVAAKAYHLPPTALIPNSPNALIHYPGLLSNESKHSPNVAATKAYDLFTSNAWEPQWIFRYGSNQRSHYHSGTHECMAVLSGSATIRFGVADLLDSDDEDIERASKEPGGVEVHAEAGDVFVIPAGVAHKTYDTVPRADFALLTPGNGRGIDAEDKRKALEEIHFDGFTMIGAYPNEGGQWDFAVGEQVADEHPPKSWQLPNPSRDPVLGIAKEGICGVWKPQEC